MYVLKCPPMLLSWLSCRIMFFSSMLFGMYHRFFDIRRSSSISNWESVPCLFPLTASLVANHFGSSFPAALTISLKLSFKQNTLVADIWNWPGLNKNCIGCRSSLPASGRRSQRLDRASGFPFLSLGLYLTTKSNSDRNSDPRACVWWVPMTKWSIPSSYGLSIPLSSVGRT